MTNQGDAVVLSLDELFALARKVLVHHGVSENHADAIARVITQGQRYDTGIPYGLMETQLALALTGVHRTEICEAIARILATQVKT